MNALPTEAQQTASLLEAKDVTIAELRSAKEAWKAKAMIAAEREFERSVAHIGFRQAAKRMVVLAAALAFLAGIAATLVAGGGL